ncbi:hypothetical protein MASR2M79_15070 [Aminivibrio sp.]
MNRSLSQSQEFPSFFIWVMIRLPNPLPLPDPVYELLPAEVMAGFSLFGQTALHHVLGGDAGVVRAGEPEDAETLHPFVSAEDILKGVIEGVPHVEGSRDVGRRDDDREGLRLILPRNGGKKTLL